MYKRLGLFLQVFFDCVCGGGEAEAGGHADKRAYAGGTIERGALRSGRFFQADFTVRGRVNGLFGGKYAIHHETPPRVAAVIELLAQRQANFCEQGVVVAADQIIDFDFGWIGKSAGTAG